MESSNGWNVERQTKTYGPYVKITLSASLEVDLDTKNPLGLSFKAGPSGALTTFAQAIQKMAPTRANADKVGFALSSMFDQVLSIQNSGGVG